jgi:parvulin-like peptidyl-prolyl isomerase
MRRALLADRPAAAGRLRRTLRWLALPGALCGVLSCAPALAAETAVAAAAAPVTPAAAEAAADAVLARVGAEPAVLIRRAEFERALGLAVRQRFYHGAAGEPTLARLRHEVLAQLVDEQLLQTEARRRGLQADAAAISTELTAQDRRYADSAAWQRQRERMLPLLQRELERQSLRAQLEQQVRQVPLPSAAEVEACYARQPERYTEPEQLRLAMILLRVEASAPQAQWDGAIAEGQAIRRRLLGGADFGELAKLHSADGSAAQGGELGYVHDGMLPSAAHEALQGQPDGSLIGPVSLLEGVALFRLHERRAARLQPLAQVRARATELCRREQADQAWQALLLRLRRDTPHQLDPERLLPPAGAEVATAPAAAGDAR